MTYNEAKPLTPNTYVKTSYDFVCWNTKADGSGKTYMDTDKFSVSSDITLYAQWYETYTLKFDGNGATSGSMKSINYSPSGECSMNSLPENKFKNEKIWNEFLSFCEKRLDQIISEGRSHQGESRPWHREWLPSPGRADPDPGS